MALRASNLNAANNPSKRKKTVEQTYTKLTQLQHILLRPDTYIGSAELVQENIWTWDEDQKAMVRRDVTYAPGLYKIFDEVLVNAADHRQRDSSMTTIRVDIDPENQSICVWNNGSGIPIEMHQKEKIYVPELIFGNLLTSSNYDDDEKKVVGGRNGYGAKLANIFSTEFTVETADAERRKKYKQVFRNNMNEKDEPLIRSNPKGDSFTKISFSPDLSRFGMTHLDADIVSLLKKRVYDIAGVNSTLKVYLNGNKLPIKNFSDYVSLYTDNDHMGKIHYERLDERWEVAITGSDGQLSQVSFVNSIWTVKGGTHVSHVADQIVTKISDHIAKKNKGMKVKPFQIKSHLSLFINCLIENPAFDSQTKETLTTKQSKFGSKWALSDDLCKKVVKSGIVENILEFARFKQSKELSKTDGGKRARISGIPKFEDANKAGTREASKCTLILTEGDSAMALAISGLSVVGRDYYGVFPLRGKLLNVREAKHKQIMDNAEITNLKKILGLQHNKKYCEQSVKSLRYGHVLIMADQDHDGSHIKGLVINLFDHFWPSLLLIEGFLQEFVTPIVKCVKGDRQKTFYTLPEFKAWLNSLAGGAREAKSWFPKYYKGLGTSTAAEAKTYFSDLPRHLHVFHHRGSECSDMIDLAFSKQRVNDRKQWLSSYSPGIFFDHVNDELNYSNFVNKELILFSVADNARSIPNVMDGLKPSQRKVLFACFKRKLVKTEIKVVQLAGYVSEHTAYHHGDQALQSTIVGLAQNFVGSNNINFLVPAGQFGTRLQGGKDAASARYVFTKLAPICRAMFSELDDPLLSYLEEDGKSIEPMWYAPIIPTVLVNGAEGIGTGWSSTVPCYNPRDIIANIRRLLRNEVIQTMIPWYRGFTGTIIPVENSKSYDVHGNLSIAKDLASFVIDELPIRSWTTPYKAFLESCMIGVADAKQPFIKDFRDNGTENKVKFSFTTETEKVSLLSSASAYKLLKLSSTISTGNMVLFDALGRIRKYDNPEEIILEFYGERYALYKKRHMHLLEELDKELLCLDNKKRFILMVINGKLKVAKRKKIELLAELKRLKFSPMPKKGRRAFDTDSDAGSDDDQEEQEVKGAYDYLLSMPLWSLTAERVEQLMEQRDRKEKEKLHMEGMTVEDLWENDLKALEEALQEDEKAALLAEKDLERAAKAARLRQRRGGAGRRGKQPKNYEDGFESEEELEKVPAPSARVVQPKKVRTKTKTLAARQGSEESSDMSDVDAELTVHLATKDVFPKASRRGQTQQKSNASRLKEIISIESDSESDLDKDTMSLSQRLAQRLTVSPAPKKATVTKKSKAAPSKPRNGTGKRTRVTKAKSQVPKDEVATISPGKSPSHKKTRVTSPVGDKAKRRSRKPMFIDDSEESDESEPIETNVVSRPRRQRAVKRVIIEESDNSEDDNESDFSEPEELDSDY